MIVQSQGKWENRFLSLAKEVAGWSKDPSTKVGAVLVRPDRTIASVGYNGFPRKMHDHDFWLQNREEKYPRMVHAEINCVDNCHDATVSGYSLYSTFMPCDRCFVQLVNNGIHDFYFPKPTEDELVRWGKFFENTKRFADDMMIVLHEVTI